MDTTHRDFDTVQRTLRTCNAATLLKLHLRFCRREYTGISKSELVDRITRNVRTYADLYEKLRTVS